LALFMVMAMSLAACAPGAASTPDTMMHDTATSDAMMMHETATPAAMMHDTATSDAMMMHETASPEAMMHETNAPDMMMDTATPDAMMGHSGATQEASKQMADWLGTSLTDVRTGQSFKLSDFSGKVVLVETMAVWCPLCFSQQQQIQRLHQMMGQNDHLVSVSLDIDPNETPDFLGKYVKSNTFDWAYAIAPAGLSHEIGQTYGNQFLDPPSTPILIIDTHGVAHTLPFGIKSAEDLMKAVQQYSGM
jgi:thiol-disulfide isomerase/thioredoxin